MRRSATRLRLGRWSPLAVGALVGLAVLALGVPLTSLARWLTRGSSTTFPAGDLTSATVTTLGLAVAGGVVATLAALPVAIGPNVVTAISGLQTQITALQTGLTAVAAALALDPIALATSAPAAQAAAAASLALVIGGTVAVSAASALIPALRTSAD